MGLIAGRPTLDVILERQNSTNRARFITSRLQRASQLLQLLEFDDTTIPNARARRLVFNYTRKQVQRVAQLRNWYQDYAAQYTTDTDASAVLRPMGDAFEIDRVFGDADPEYVQEQIDAMAPGIGSLFADLSINGDTTADGREFDGLSTILEGTAQELSGTGMSLARGVSDGDLRETLGAVQKRVRRLRGMGLTPVILGNEDATHRFTMAAGQLNFIERRPDQFGADINTFAGAYILDVGVTNAKSGNTVVGQEIIPTVGGLTDLYVVGISRTNGFTGLTLAGGQGRPEPVQYRTANTDSGVVRRFEAEVVGGVALLDEQAAVVFRDVRVEPSA